MRDMNAQPIRDLNDGKPWSEMDLSDLRNSLAYGRSIEEVAGFLCRSGTVEEVKRKGPFPRPKHGRICVKVINHFGDEVQKVFMV
jgi:hypothetical protein